MRQPIPEINHDILHTRAIYGQLQLIAKNTETIAIWMERMTESLDMLVQILDKIQSSQKAKVVL